MDDLLCISLGSLYSLFFHPPKSSKEGVLYSLLLLFCEEEGTEGQEWREMGEERFRLMVNFRVQWRCNFIVVRCLQCSR